MFDTFFAKFILPEDLREALGKCRSIAYIETQDELDELVFGPTHTSQYDVVYNIVGKGTVKEAEVIRCKNGALVNFMVLHPAGHHAPLQGRRPGQRL